MRHQSCTKEMCAKFHLLYKDLSSFKLNPLTLLMCIRITINKDANFNFDANAEEFDV